MWASKSLCCCQVIYYYVYNVIIVLFFPGCTLFFYETDGRSGIDNNSIPKHAIWVENSIVQAVPEHPKKDFVFCLSNSLGDAFLFQVRESLNVIWSVNKCKFSHGQALP